MVPRSLVTGIGIDYTGGVQYLGGISGSTMVSEPADFIISMPNQGNSTHTTNVAVNDYNKDVILGLDYLRATNSQIDTLNNRVYVRDEVWETAKDILAFVGGIALVVVSVYALSRLSR